MAAANHRNESWRQLTTATGAHAKTTSSPPSHPNPNPNPQPPVEHHAAALRVDVLRYDDLVPGLAEQAH